MKLSVAYTFEPGIISRLARYPQVYEIYGKLDKDLVGGGRSTYTLRPTSRRAVVRSVNEAHAYGISFNYLLNGATLGGVEQTRRGQKQIRSYLDWLSEIGVDSLTVASPYLLRVIKSKYPHFNVRVSAFAVVDSATKAQRWEDMGADTICVSAIACNRDFRKLRAIRSGVSCELQLIANAACLSGCSHELTHMNMLSSSSRRGDRLKGFCLDYCFLHCTTQRIRDPREIIRAVWIRPEDLALYEEEGYDNFKLVERSCPGDLLETRVRSYAARRFEGNLWKLVGPVASVKKSQGTPLRQRIRMVTTQLKPENVRIRSLLDMKKYAEHVIQSRYDRPSDGIFINNRDLDGYLAGIKKRSLGRADRCRECSDCGYCESWAQKAIHIDPAFREKSLRMAASLDKGTLDGSVWG